MKVYLISLNDSKEKIDYLKQFGIETTLVKGVDGKTASSEDLARVSKMYQIIGPKGAIGCALAHLNTWKQFLETEEEYAIIFEDDVILEDNFLENLNAILKEVPETYDILYLGCTGCDHTQNINIIKHIGKLWFIHKDIPAHQQISKHVGKPSIAFATHAYIVSRKGAKQLLELLEGNISNHIDFCIQKLVLDKKIESYVATPRIVHQTSADSSPSENVVSNYPLLINSMLHHIHIDKHYRAQYMFSTSLMRIGNFNVNIFTFLFIFAGLLCLYKKVHIKYITLGFILFSIPDILSIKTGKDIQIIILYYLLLSIPSILKYLSIFIHIYPY
jgi:GR25 family glycosyltransferase involved in LPS biosynthesis